MIDDLSPSGFGMNWSLLLKKKPDGSKTLIYPTFLFCRAVQRPALAVEVISAGQIIDDSLRHEPNMAQASLRFQ